MGGEGIGREGDLVKEGAGVLGAAAGVGAALLGGDGVVEDRHDQLGRPLQTDDGELAQGHEEPLLVAAQHQIVPEHGLDIRGDGQGAWLTDPTWFERVFLKKPEVGKLSAAGVEKLWYEES